MNKEREKPEIQIGTFEAKKHLSKLLVDVRRGKAYVITSRGKPIARLVPYLEGRTTPMEELLDSFRRIRGSVTASDNVKGYIRKGRS